MGIWNKITDFCKNSSGQISVIACVAALPLIGAVGAGVDYSFLASSRAALQKEADTEALERRGGRWIDDTLYQVDKEATVDTYFMGIIGQKQVHMSVTAQVKTRMPTPKLHPASVVPLGGSSSGYNVMGAYCYNPKKNIRHSFVDVVDNRGHKFMSRILTCNEGEEINYYLKNYTNIHMEYKTTTSRNEDGALVTVYSFKGYQTGLSNACTVNGSEYDETSMNAFRPTSESDECRLQVFFSDSGSKNGEKLEGISAQSADLESVLCLPLEGCVIKPCNPSSGASCAKTKSHGGKIPEGNHRTPISQMRNCAPGENIYLGWNDTLKKRYTINPVNDYNDLQVAFECPDYQKEITYLVR